MTPRNSVVALCRSFHPGLMQVVPSFVLSLESELIIRFADTPAVGGILGSVVAVAVRAIGCLGRYSKWWVADRLLPRMLKRAGHLKSAGCSRGRQQVEARTRAAFADRRQVGEHA